MKKNVKVAIAIIIAVLLSVASVAAFATEADNEPQAVETPVVEKTEAPKAEAPKAEAPKAEETKAEEKVEESKAEETKTEETVKPTAEPTVEATVEPTAEPTVEATVEPTAEPTEEPVVEPTEEPGVEGTVEIEMVNKGQIYIGDTVTLKATLKDYTVSYKLQWQYAENGEWKNLSGETDDTLTFEVTEENANYEWRLAVIAE